MHFFRKNGRYVYVMESRNKALPRSVTKHLDSEPDHNIEFWIQDYQKKNGIEPESKHPIANKYVSAVEAYLNERSSRKSPKTLSDHKRMLLDFIIPFFTLVHKRVDPNQWPAVAPKLSTYLRENGCSEFQLQKANSAIRGFWDWLAEEQQILGNVKLRLKGGIRDAKPTPLPRPLAPAEVLAFAHRCSDPEVALMGLLGYFFSLRPQETFALRPTDFLAGLAASNLECCKVMGRHNQYTKFAVNITKQRTQGGKITKPKAHSVGWVACFNEIAARLIVSKIKDLPAEKLLTRFGNDWNFERWNRLGIKGISLKDLRRASLYHLGHHAGFEFSSLRAHARHSRADTTLLYLRRPEEINQPGSLDLDA